MKKHVPDPPHPILPNQPDPACTPSNDPNIWTTAGTETFLGLYQIQPGIPFLRAFDELSMLLGCIEHHTCEAEMGGDILAGSSARVLSAMAKALINDLEVGMQERGE